MIVEERLDILEDEVLILQNSGEIPEIALHSTLYYLTRDEDGPQITLEQEELEILYDAAEKRYREIVLRDLDPANRDLSIYRGVARSIANWQRYQDFCRRIGRDCQEFKISVQKKSRDFLLREYLDVSQRRRPSSINCCMSELFDFLKKLDVDPASLPDDWQIICPY